MVIEVDPAYKNGSGARGSSEKSDPENTPLQGVNAQDRDAQPSNAPPFWRSIVPKRHIHDPDGRYDDYKVKPVRDYPDGYPQLSAWINTDDNFRVYRRYGELRNRILLHYQLKLAKLEERLEQMDWGDKSSSDDRDNYRLSSLEYDQERDNRRQGLVEEIEIALEKYDTLLERENKSLSLPKPTDRNHRNIINYIWNKKAIAQEETRLFSRKDDAIILARDQDSPFHVFLEDLYQTYSWDWFREWLASPDQREKSKGCTMRLVSKTRVNFFIRFVVTFVTVCLLMIPVCLLFTLDSASKIKVTVILLFVLLFPVAVSVFAQPRSHELVAATAAYTAVLVVFLQNFSDTTTNTSKEF